MADTMSSEQRSKLMAKIRMKDTAIERKVRSFLFSKGYRFYKNVSKMSGSPDIVLSKYRAAIFIHGCFWHGHYKCKKSRLPSTRIEYWSNKRRANIERDHRKIVDLISMGWRVAIIWQCGIEKTDLFYESMHILERWISSDEAQCEIPNNGNGVYESG